MNPTYDRQLDRLTIRLAELAHWRVRACREIADWTLDGAPIEVGGAWPSREGRVHFAARASAPPQWPLEETRLSLNLGGESLLTLTYPDGARESFGLDPHHEEFPLRGRDFAVAAQSVARLPFGQPVHAPRLNRAVVFWIDLPVERLHLLLTQVAEAVRALEDDEVTPHLMEAAERALRALDWPSRTPTYVARTSPAPAQQTIWRLPPLEPDPDPLTPAEQASVVAAHDALLAELDALRLRFPPRGEIAVTGHAHIDLAWLWPYDETRRKLRRTFATALSLMERSPDFRFNQSTAHYYAQLEEDDPGLLAKIRDKAKSGQWEVIGGMWVEPDTNMPTGESLARQLLYGQRYFERSLGVRPRICWLPDCFGFSPALPQLLRQAGIDSFFTIKVNWSEHNRFPFDLFWWEGLDGSRVLAHTFDNPHGGYNGRLRPDALVPTWKNFRGKVDHHETLLAVGFGDGGGGVTPEMVERETQLRHFPALPRARWARVDEFFAAAHARAAQRELPRWVGEIYLELHRGTLTTQSGVKRLHRAAERALITAETLASLAHLLGAPAPESLEPTWRVVLKNEFHDILPGSSIHEVYEDAEAELSGAIAAGAAVQQAAMQSIAAHLPRGDIADALVVVNPTLAPRPLRLRGDAGESLASDDMVPPLGIVVLDRARLAPTPGLTASRRRLENTQLVAEFGDDGTLTSLIHKPSGREALAGRGNQLWAYRQDKPRSWDAWDIDEDYAKSGEEIRDIESFELVETGPHFAALRVVRRFRASRIAQTYRLAANGRRLDIETSLDWRDRRVLLRSLTPAAVRSSRASFECAYGIIERATHRNTSWQATMFEAVAHRFVDLAETDFGLALLNNAKYGHSVLDNVLGVSLVRSPISPDPLADEGAQSFTYALMPHAGAGLADVLGEADDLNQPLPALLASGLTAGALQPLGAAGAGAALSGLKPAEDGDGLILRAYAPTSARAALALRPPEGWRVVGEVNLMEEPCGPSPADLQPFEVRSWRLTRRE